MSEEMIFRPCRTCGKYMNLYLESKQVYCSPECSQTHTKCTTCGKWFASNQGHAGYCSSDCAEIYTEKLKLFKELE